MTGVDRERTWVEQASDRASAAGLFARYSYRLGDALQLPFDSGTFDFVTCQTVLIHLADPRVAIREMLRVLKPGSLLAVVELNNLAGAMLADRLAFDMPIEEALELVRFQMMCERGKAGLRFSPQRPRAELPDLHTGCWSASMVS